MIVVLEFNGHCLVGQGVKASNGRTKVFGKVFDVDYQYEYRENEKDDLKPFTVTVQNQDGRISTYLDVTSIKVFSDIGNTLDTANSYEDENDHPYNY